MKKLILLSVTFLVLIFSSCKERVDITDEGNQIGNVRNTKLYKTTSPIFGLWDVWFRPPYSIARVDSFINLHSHGIKYIALGGFYANETRKNGAWNWTSLDTDYHIFRDTIGFERIVFPISHEQVQGDNGWTSNLVENYIDHCKSLTGTDAYFFLDEPYLSHSQGKSITNLSSILNNNSIHIYLAEPFTDYSVPEADLNKCYSIVYDYYDASLQTKNNWYRYLSIDLGEKLSPILRIFADSNHIDQDGLRDELYTAAPYSNEIWYYSYDAASSFYLYTPLTNWNNFLLFLQNYSGEHYGKWDLKCLEDYGGTEAIPCPADYDGDGYTDISVKTNNGEWLIDYSHNGFGSWDVELTGYGTSFAHPCPADYDGDGKADISIKTDDGQWLIDYANNGFGVWQTTLTGYGTSSAHPCPADYDGDGKADISVKTDDGQWLIDYANNGFGVWQTTLTGYGTSFAHPCPADYDGDGKADISVKTDDGQWLIDYANNGFGVWQTTLTGYGTSSAHPCPADYDGDGKADISVKTDDGQWLIDYANNGFGVWQTTLTGYGTSTSIPCPADYDGDGYADLAVKTSDGKFLIDYYKINFDWYH